jgi:hypothetical protein
LEKSKFVEVLSMKKRILIGAVAVLLIVCCGVYFGGNIGIAEEKISREQRETVSWEEQDYSITGTSNGGALYVGVLYRNDHAAAKYFIYVKKSGLLSGWHFLQSGGLTDADGLVAFDCGKYGTAYVALNQDDTIQKIELEEDGTPSVREIELENGSGPICVPAENGALFYNASGELVEPTRVAVLQ